MNNTLGLSTSCLFPLNTKATFQAAQILGYDSVEVLVTQQAATRDYKLLDTYQQQYQIPIGSIHAPTLLATAFVYGTHGAKKVLRTTELATKLGAKTVIVHPPTFLKPSYSKKFLSLVNELQQETEVRIAVENMFPWRTGGKSREVYMPSWETIASSDLIKYLTFDFSHASLSGIDTMQELVTNYSKIAHIHFCDGSGYKTKKSGENKDKVFDEHLIPGHGTQPIKEAIKFLYQQKWTGQMVAEINTRKFLTFDKKLSLLEETKLFFEKCYADAEQ